jgi:hypothetical protein
LTSHLKRPYGNYGKPSTRFGSSISFDYPCCCCYYLLIIRQPSNYSPVKLSQRFNISTPDKPKLVMELICDMDTPQKAPLMREIVKGSSASMFIETHNNQQKYFVHIPKCSTEASAML